MYCTWDGDGDLSQRRGSGSGLGADPGHYRYDNLIVLLEEHPIHSAWRGRT
jgi:hypothetical protein